MKGQQDASPVVNFLERIYMSESGYFFFVWLIDELAIALAFKRVDRRTGLSERGPIFLDVDVFFARGISQNQRIEKLNGD